MAGFAITFHDKPIAFAVQADRYPILRPFQFYEISDVGNRGDLSHPENLLAGIFLFQAVDQVIGQIVFSVIAERTDKVAVLFIGDPVEDPPLHKTNNVSIVRFLPIYPFGIRKAFAEFLQQFFTDGQFGFADAGIRSREGETSLGEDFTRFINQEGKQEGKACQEYLFDNLFLIEEYYSSKL